MDVLNLGFDCEKMSFGQHSSAARGMQFMSYCSLLEFLGFPETAHRSRPGIYAIPRPVPDICLLFVFYGFFVSERLGDDRVGYGMLYSDLWGHYRVLRS